MQTLIHSSLLIWGVGFHQTLNCWDKKKSYGDWKMTYLFTKTLSRRPEYNSLVEEFEDYDEEEIQNLELVKEDYKRKK